MFDWGGRAVAGWNLRHRDREADAARLPDRSRPPGTEAGEGAEGADGLAQIRHIVVLMMENHSFDNYLGTLGHGDGLCRQPGGEWGPANETASGAVIHPYHLPSTTQHSGDPTQSWTASHIQYADGANSGFPTSIEQTVPGGDPRIPMGFFDAQDLPFYAGLASTFALADRWHCSLLGPTFPNRRFLISGTAHGLIDDVFTGMFDYPRNGTLFDLLDRHRISWANYHHVTPARVIAKRALGAPGLRTSRALRLLFTTVFPQALKVGKDNFQFTADIYPLGLLRCLGHLRPVTRFFDDARDGTLPAVSIVDPDFQASSEENPQDVQIGEGFAAAVVDAVMHGKGWPHTLLVWLYDEHGGYHDHVPPPAAVEPDDVLPHSLLDAGGRLRWLVRSLLQWLGYWPELRRNDSGTGRYDRYGFRVPAVIVSPYAKPGYVSSVTYDHTSILELIERKWNLPPLTRRDEAATDLLDTIDFAHPAFLDPPELPAPARPWTSGS